MAIPIVRKFWGKMPRTQPTYFSAEDIFVEISVEKANAITMELVVILMGSPPPHILIGGAIAVTLQVPQHFFLRMGKGQRLPLPVVGVERKEYAHDNGRK